MSKEAYCSEGGYDGVVNSYCEEGKLISQESWQNGIKDGECIEFDEDGRVISRGIYRNGEPFDGTFLEVRESQSGNSTLWFLDVRRVASGRDMGVLESIPLDSGT
jgi:hypothetical protein